MEKGLNLCQTGNSKFLALNVSPTPTSTTGGEVAGRRRLTGLSPSALGGRGVARVLSTAQVAAKWQLACQMGERHMLPSGKHKGHSRDLRSPTLRKWTYGAKEEGTKFYSLKNGE